MHTLKECLRMEATCTRLALKEPHNKERWRAEAKMWHQRAGLKVVSMFEETGLELKDEKSDHPVKPSS